MGRWERASLKSAYKYQTAKYTRTWYNTVDRERGEVVDTLAENLGLQPSREETFEKAYALGRKDAARETGLPLKSFSQSPPFTLAECERSAFLPQELRDHLAARKTAADKKKGTGKAE